MSNSYYDVTDTSTFTLDNATFDVESTGALNLTGDANLALLEAGVSQWTTIAGTGNTIVGLGDYEYVSLSGEANVATLGDNSMVEDFGDSSSVFLGSSGFVEEFGTNASINAANGFIELYGPNAAVTGSDSVDVYAAPLTADVTGDGNKIWVDQAKFEVDGNNNQVQFNDGACVLQLNGSGNSVSMAMPTSIWLNPQISENSSVTTNTATVTLGQSEVNLTGSADTKSVTLINGVATVQLGSGNVATINNVASGETLTYTDASGNKTSTTLMDSDLTHTAGNLYKVSAQGVQTLVTMNNAIFNVAAGASLAMTGTSDQAILNNGAQGVEVLGAGNTVMGSSASGASAYVAGANNTVVLGADAYIDDTQASGDTLTVGSGSYVKLGSGDSLTVNGNNSTVYFDATKGTQMIKCASGDYVQEQADGTILFSGASYSLNDNVATFSIDGNVVNVSNVTATADGGLTAKNSVNQLVSAMSGYSGQAGGGNLSVTMAQTTVQPTLFASAYH